jgi:hypothetical protein
MTLLGLATYGVGVIVLTLILQSALSKGAFFFDIIRKLTAAWAALLASDLWREGRKELNGWKFVRQICASRRGCYFEEVAL